MALFSSKLFWMEDMGEKKWLPGMYSFHFKATGLLALFQMLEQILPQSTVNKMVKPYSG